MSVIFNLLSMYTSTILQNSHFIKVSFVRCACKPADIALFIVVFV